MLTLSLHGGCGFFVAAWLPSPTNHLLILGNLVVKIRSKACSLPPGNQFHGWKNPYFDDFPSSKSQFQHGDIPAIFHPGIGLGAGEACGSEV